jgi:hypothetical protein
MQTKTSKEKQTSFQVCGKILKMSLGVRKISKGREVSLKGSGAT